MNKLFTCCGRDPIWVENVPGKGYNFCQECRQEVATPLTVEDANNEFLSQEMIDKLQAEYDKELADAIKKVTYTTWPM